MQEKSLFITVEDTVVTAVASDDFVEILFEHCGKKIVDDRS